MPEIGLGDSFISEKTKVLLNGGNICNKAKKPTSLTCTKLTKNQDHSKMCGFFFLKTAL